MLDVRTHLGRIRDPRSELMRAQAGALSGEKVNFCPFGCSDDELDDHGYCRHLVGFTSADHDGCKMMEKRIVDPALLTPGCRERVGPEREAVQKRDKLVQITSSYRVYREAGLSQARIEES